MSKPACGKLGACTTAQYRGACTRPSCPARPTAIVAYPPSEFTGTLVKNGEFTEVSLKDYLGKWVVLFFYPLDFTCE